MTAKNFLNLSITISLGISRTAFSQHKLKIVTEYLSPFQIKRPDGSLGGYSTEVIE